MHVHVLKVGAAGGGVCACEGEVGQAGLLLLLLLTAALLLFLPCDCLDVPEVCADLKLLGVLLLCQLGEVSHRPLQHRSRALVSQCELPGG